VAATSTDDRLNRLRVAGGAWAVRRASAPLGYQSLKHRAEVSI
jgi:hypothetical protein